MTVSQRRAVITGIGIVAPTGIGADEHWKTVLAGESRLGRITLFDPSRYPTRLAGEVADFDAAVWADNRLRVQTDRWTHLAFAASQLALADSRLDVVEESFGVTLASSSGGNNFGQKELQRLWSQPSRTVGAYQSIAWFYAASVGQVSIRHQFKGPCAVQVAEAAGGLDSLAQAARTIRRGTPVVLAGATECPLSPYALACQLRGGLLSTGDDPAQAYRPFDRQAAGHVPGEGGAVFVVEELTHALERRATIYGEIAGWGATHDARHTGRDATPDAVQYAHAMTAAIERSGINPSDVDFVVPDAMGVPRYDRSEADALHLTFGAEPPPVTTQKPLTGRAYQGSAALDVANALLAVRHGVLPPTAGLGDVADGCELDHVREARTGRPATALVGARGFDGFNSALLLRAYEGGSA